MSELYTIKKETMTNIADSVRELTGTTAAMNAIEIANTLEDKAQNGGFGIQLPELTNPGTASHLLAGKELIDQEGNIVTGTIPTRSSSDVALNLGTVDISAGYYARDVAKIIPSGSATTPATTITKNPTISVDSAGKITASVSGTQNVTPTVNEGYVSSGTAGTITVSGSATKQLTTQAAKTVTPTTTSQTAVASGVYTTGAITVGAIPSQYINTTDATAAANEIFKNETAYVNGSKVTGTFTIDSEVTEQNNLIAQIKTAISNKAAYNTIYIGSDVPESSIGADGDIYIVTGGTV